MLGTCGMMPMPGRWLSCALMRCGSSLTLVDCGEGTQVPWKSLGWGFRQLGAICLTHMHADHVAGLPVQLWSRLQRGETLEYNGRTITPDLVLGPPRRGISLAFITDTRPTQQLSAFARDVDLLICESMYDNAEDFPLAKAHAHMLA